MPIDIFVNNYVLKQKKQRTIVIPTDKVDYDDAIDYRREEIVDTLAKALETILKTNGYDVNVALVERQGIEILDSVDDYTILLSDDGQTYNNVSTLGTERMGLSITIVGIVKDSRHDPEYILDTKLKIFLSQVIRCLELNNTLGNLVCEIKYEADRLSGHRLYPQAAFELPITIDYETDTYFQV